jgi:hypothetical protein
MPKREVVSKADTEAQGNVKSTTTFKIGGHYYDLSLVDHLISQHSLWGRCNHISKHIEIDSTIKISDFMATLIHEGMEGINTQRSLNLEHNVLTNMEDGIFQMLIDNADLFIGLLKELKEKGNAS